MMCELVDQLLILSRHDSGQEISMIEEVHADVLLLDVLERVRPLAESRESSSGCRRCRDGSCWGTMLV